MVCFTSVVLAVLILLVLIYVAPKPDVMAFMLVSVASVLRNATNLVRLHFKKKTKPHYLKLLKKIIVKFLEMKYTVYETYCVKIKPVTITTIYQE